MPRQKTILVGKFFLSLIFIFDFYCKYIISVYFFTVDEQIEGTKVAAELNTPTKMELSDPAILEVVEQRRLTYTREELMKLRDSPFSLLQPTNM